MITTIIWILTLSFHYGYHSAVFNQLQHLLNLDNAQFALLTAIFTLAGFIASLLANVLIDTGRRYTARISAALVSIGSLSLAILPHTIFPLLIGRAITGAGAGIAL